MKGSAVAPVPATRIVIVGAGPAGLLLAHYLCRRENCAVLVLEKRPDPRDQTPSERRTYPVGLQTHRGLRAVQQIDGLQSALEKVGVWTVSMCAHNNTTGKARRIPRDFPNLSVDRNHIVLTLLEELLTAPLGPNSSLKMVFDTTVTSVDAKNKTIQVQMGHDAKHPTASSKPYDVLAACDGAHSTIRELLVAKGLLPNCRTQPIDDEYKCLYLRKASLDGSLPPLFGDSSHGWMFGDRRVIAVPAADGETLNAVFIFPRGQDPLRDLVADGQAVLNYLGTLSPGSLCKYITLEEASNLGKRPAAGVLSVSGMDTLHVGASVVLLGDAAHAVSPALGQGCNAALEDVQLLCQCLEAANDNWSAALPSFSALRLPDVQALVELSTYATPRTRWMRLEWLVRMVLHALLPAWLRAWLFLRPLPAQLLSRPDLTYRQVLKKCSWWTNRVKRSMPQKAAS